MKKSLALAGLLVGAALLSTQAYAAPICASTISCTFTIDAASINAGVAPYGTVNLSLIGDVIRFTVDLNQLGDDPGLRLIQTGGPHAAFAINYGEGFNPAAGTVTLTNFKTTTSDTLPFTLINPNQYTGQPTLTYSNGGPGGATPYGDFDLRVLTNCGNGGGCGVNVLIFDAVYSGGGFTDVNQLIGLNGDNDMALFAMDVTNQGTTGSIAVTSTGTDITINQVPEPGTMGMLGFALAGLGLIARRKRS